VRPNSNTVIRPYSWDDKTFYLRSQKLPVRCTGPPQKEKRPAIAPSRIEPNTRPGAARQYSIARPNQPIKGESPTKGTFVSGWGYLAAVHRNLGLTACRTVTRDLRSTPLSSFVITRGPVDLSESILKKTHRQMTGFSWGGEPPKGKIPTKRLNGQMKGRSGDPRERRR
jgi:hypothetical protein